MKKHAKNLFRILGYNVEKIKKQKSDLDLYIKIFGKESVEKRRFYNIGGGIFNHPAWTVIDFVTDWYRKNEANTGNNIHFDLMSLKPLPIDSESAEIVFTSHTVEHITDEAAQNMFDESFRILKKNGIFRVTTPNIDLAYRAYKENDKEYFYWYKTDVPTKINGIEVHKSRKESSIAQLFLFSFAATVSIIVHDKTAEKIDDQQLTKIFSEMKFEKAMDYIVAKCPVNLQKKYPGFHMNWWNKDKMFRVLKKAGFKTVYLSAHRQSYSPVLRNQLYFDNTKPAVSLYVEAKK